MRGLEGQIGHHAEARHQLRPCVAGPDKDAVGTGERATTAADRIVAEAKCGIPAALVAAGVFDRTKVKVSGTILHG